MKDRLEKYITHNKSSFSDLDSPPLMWEKISKELENEFPTKKGRSIRSIYLFVSGMAASLLIAAAAIFAYQNINSNVYGNTMASSPTLKEYKIMEERYVHEVNTRMDNLEALKVDKTIEDDLLQLDAIYQELKAELISSGNMNNHEIIDALIKNYNTKIDLLEFIQSKYAKSKKNEEETINI